MVMVVMVHLPALQKGAVMQSEILAGEIPWMSSVLFNAVIHSLQIQGPS